MIHRLWLALGLTAALFLPAAGIGGERKLPAGAPDVDLAWGTPIPMRDGVRLNATVYWPAGTRRAVPVVFTLTPYVSDTYHERAMYFARHGYIFVLVDVRGRGNSGGEFDPFANDAHDGYDVVEWLAKQPWCNGKVGMWGGSYAGFDQWATLKELPPHLATIVPAAAAHPGVDFPARKNIFTSYLVQWLTYTGGRTPNTKLFSEASYWHSKFYQRYTEHIAFNKLDTLVGNPSPYFQKWLERRTPDAYWDSLVPGPKEYAQLDLPILTITGQYDSQQPGAFTYYRNHMEHGSASGRAKHFLLLGPWDHLGTRTPVEEMAGLNLGKASVLDLNRLHKEWYDWTLKDGKKPAFLEKRVAYYVTGADAWRYADSLDSIPSRPVPLYLNASDGSANDVFHSGKLDHEKPGKNPPVRYVYNPLDVRPGAVEMEGNNFGLRDQRDAMNLYGCGVIFHSDPLPTAMEIAGTMKFTAWVALDVSDTDFGVSVYEVRSDGTSVFLAGDQLRARYRLSARKEQLVKPGAVERYEFTGFPFVARKLERGSRIRLVFAAPNSIHTEKNYNSGGEVAEETRKDARTAHVVLHQDEEHSSVLELPVLKASE